MVSRITSKYQVTIPRKVRASLRLGASDSIEWNIGDGRVTVMPAKKPFLLYRNMIQVGRGDIKKDIAKGRLSMGKRHA